MRKEFGEMVKKYRHKRELERAELARKLEISLGYVLHLENECCSATFSPALMERVIDTLKLPRRKALTLAEAHNRRVARYFKKRREAA